jgi:hypothetical protein
MIPDITVTTRPSAKPFTFLLNVKHLVAPYMDTILVGLTELLGIQRSRYKFSGTHNYTLPTMACQDGTCKHFVPLTPTISLSRVGCPLHSGYTMFMEHLKATPFVSSIQYRIGVVKHLRKMPIRDTRRTPVNNKVVVFVYVLPIRVHTYGT